MFPIAEKQVFKKNHNIGGYYAVVRDAYLNIHSPFSFTCNYSILLSILKAVNLSLSEIYGKHNVHIIGTIFPLFLKQYRKLFSCLLYLYGTYVSVQDILPSAEHREKRSAGQRRNG